MEFGMGFEALSPAIINYVEIRRGFWRFDAKIAMLFLALVVDPWL